MCYNILRQGGVRLKIDKITRVLYLYNLLRDGKKINKTLFSLDYEVSERGFDRDIQDIRLMLGDMGIYDEIIYDKSDNTYYLTGQDYYQLDETSAFIFGKLLLSSKDFREDETEELLKSLSLVTDKHKRSLLSQKFNTDTLRCDEKNNKNAIVKLIHDLSNCILNQWRISLCYNKKTYIVKPTNINFDKSGFVLYAEDKNKELQSFLIKKIAEFKVI